MADVQKDIVLRVKSETDQATGQFKNLKQELRSIEGELNKMASAGQTGTEAFRKLQQRAGEVKDQIGDTKNAIKALSSDTFKLDAFTQAAQGIAGGFAAAQGAMSLFGTENKQVEEAIKKTQGAMALLQGVTAITNILQKDSAFSMMFLSKAQTENAVATNVATTATKGFSRALIATGIGAIIVLIGTLIAYWDDLKEVVSSTNLEMEATSEAVKDIGKEFSKERGEVEKLAYEYKQVNTSAQRKKEIIEKLQEISPNYFKTLNKEKTSVDDLTKAQTKFNQALIKQALLKGYQKQLEELASKQAQVNTELETGTREASLWQQTLNFIGTSIAGVPNVTAEVLNNVDAVKGANEELQKNQKQIDAVLKLINETETELNKMGGVAIEEAPRKVEKVAKVVRQGAIESIDTLDMLQSKFAEVVNKSRENIDNLRAKDIVESQNELLKTSLEGQLAMFNQYQANYNHSFDEMIMNQRDALTQGVIDYKTYTENIAKLDALRIDGQRATAKAIGDVFGALSETLGKETKAGKALATAQALINTYLGISEVLRAKNPYPEPFGTAVKIASAATIGINGFNTVRSINKVQVPGGGGGGAVGSMPNLSTAPSAMATTTPTIGSTQLELDAQGNLKQQSVRTYVLETDISDKQKRSQRLQRTATLGK